MKQTRVFAVVSAVLVAVALVLVAPVQSQTPYNRCAGAMLPSEDCTVSGQWTFTHASAPVVFYNLTGFLKANGSGAVTASNTIAASGGLTSSSATAGVGYATGAGCAVTQITSRATGVTCTGTSGAITTDSTSLAAETSAVFTVTDTSVAIGDVVVVSIRSGRVGLMTDVVVTATAAGSFALTVMNGNAAAGAAETGAIVINFAVIKAVSA